MNRANRAAQFQPFDALKGLQEELRMRSNVEIVFYRNGRYYELTGYVFAKNDTYKYLIIGEEKIAYDDIYDIRVE